MTAGGTHAQFIGVAAVAAGGVLALGAKAHGWWTEADKLRVQMEAERVKTDAQISELRSEIGRAHARGAAETEKWFLFAYGDECSKLR